MAKPKSPKPPKPPKPPKTNLVSSPRVFQFNSSNPSDIDALLQRLKDEFLQKRKEGQELRLTARLLSKKSLPKTPKEEAKVQPSFRILLPSHPGGRKQGFVLQELHLPKDPNKKPPLLDPDVASLPPSERLVLYREFAEQIRALFAQVQAFSARSFYGTTFEEKSRWLSQSVLETESLLRVVSMGRWDWRDFGTVVTAPWLRFALQATFDALFESFGRLPELPPFSNAYADFLAARDQEEGERRLEVLERGVETNPYLAAEIEHTRLRLRRALRRRGRFQEALVSTVHLPVFLESPRWLGEVKAACGDSPPPFSRGAWKAVLEAMSEADWAAISSVPYSELEVQSCEEAITLEGFDLERFFRYCTEEDPREGGSAMVGGSRRVHPSAWTLLGWRVALTGLAQLRERAESLIPALESEIKEAFLRSVLPRLEDPLF